MPMHGLSDVDIKWRSLMLLKVPYITLWSFLLLIIKFF